MSTLDGICDIVDDDLSTFAGRGAAFVTVGETMVQCGPQHLSTSNLGQNRGRMSHKKVLITGAYGLIGNIVYGCLAENSEAYDVYGLARRHHPSDRVPKDQVHEIPGEKFFLVNLSDWEGMRRAVQGMDVVVHMAADPSGMRGWESILNNNLIGTYHVFEACRLAGIKRVIFASSIQVSFGYRFEAFNRSISNKGVEATPAEIPRVTHQQPARPLNLYAASKVWGEALAHVYAYSHEMSFICLRIGWVTEEDRPQSHPRASAVWCSQRDIVQLVERCIGAPPSVHFAVFYGVSDNRDRFVDIEHAREVVGYVPQDRAEDYVDDERS